MDKLLQLIKANQGRGQRIEAKANGDEVTIYLYDVIDSWFGINAQEFVKEIAGITAKTIHLRINSPGGAVFDARAIHTALSQHPARVISHIDGLAASSASFIALAGDEIEISEGAFYMIHKAWGLAIGNSDDMLDFAALLEKADGTLVRDYQRKSGQSDEQIQEWMKAETWFTADEAIEAGFVDRIYKGKEAENKYDLSMFDNTPEKLKATAQDIYVPEQAEPSAKEESDEDLSDLTREQRGRKLALVQSGT